MKKATSNRVNMIRTTLTYCTNNPTPTAGITAFATAKTAADNKLVLIDALTQITEGNTKGVTTDTNLLRETMCNIALKCGDAVSAYASSVNNNTLRDLVTYTMPQLNRLKKDEVDDVCQTIHDEANNNIAAAGAFGYVAADVTDLQTAIGVYRTSAQNPRQASITKKMANANRDTLVREIIDDLFKKQMDKMVKTLKATEPDFVQGYFLAREIINIGSTTAKVRGTVTSENDGVPLSNVKFTIYETGTTAIVKQVITDAEGKYKAAELLPGDYDLKWELNGYKTVNEYNVHIAAGKELKRNLVMEEGGGSATLEADVPASSIANVPVKGLHIMEDSTMRLEVAGSVLRFYASASNTGGPGSQYFDVAPGQIFTKTVLQWIEVFGFDEEIEDFLNVQNVNGAVGHYKMKWENLGA